MVGWHHQLNAHEFEHTLGVGDGQGGLVCCSPWSLKESDMTERLNWTEVLKNSLFYLLVVMGLLCFVGSSLLSANRDYSMAGSQASHWRGFSYYGAQALGCPGFSSCSSQAPGHRLGSCCTWGQWLHGMWDLPGSGIKPMSAALAGGFFATEPPGKP